MSIASHHANACSAIVQPQHTIRFGVEPRLFKSTRSGIQLPKECSLSSESLEPNFETAFITDPDDQITTKTGHASSQLLGAARVIAESAVLPFDDLVGMRAIATSSGVTITAYLQRDVVQDGLYDVCRKIASLIDINVAAVQLEPIRQRQLTINEHREHRKWLLQNLQMQ
jgi:hypothetical protein